MEKGGEGRFLKTGLFAFCVELDEVGDLLQKWSKSL